MISNIPDKNHAGIRVILIIIGKFIIFFIENE